MRSIHSFTSRLEGHSGHGGGCISSWFIMNFDLNYLDLQGIRIQEHDLAGLFEPWDGYQGDYLTNRSFDQGGFESRLISHKEDVRTLLDDEGVVSVERITPW
jgi:hypothetical protein